MGSKRSHKAEFSSTGWFGASRETVLAETVPLIAGAETTKRLEFIITRLASSCMRCPPYPRSIGVHTARLTHCR